MESERSMFFLNGKHAGSKPPSWFNHSGVGVFETLRARLVSIDSVWVLGLDAHLDRLEQGNTVIKSSVFNRKRLDAELVKVIRSFDWNSCANARVRIVLLPNDFIISIEPWSQVYDIKNGVSACTYAGERSLPEVKSCSGIVPYLGREKAAALHVAEAFLIDRDGVLTEGSWSNFFWVDTKGALITPARNILFGVTRSLVIDLAATEFNVVERNVSFREIMSQAREAFLTQTSHGIVPVTSIDQQQIGNGKVGLTTERLREYYRNFMEVGAEPFTRRIAL